MKLYFLGSAREALAVAAALSAFAANSLLCRWALHVCAMDPAGLGSIRLVSAAVTLVLVSWVARRPLRPVGGHWASALLLCVYVFCFSSAYVELAAGTGALVLFALVQVTMLGGALEAGESVAWKELAGGTAAMAGLFVLLAPGWQTPSLKGALLMAIAGMAWGIYSLRGRSAVDSLHTTTGNFVRALPFSVLMLIVVLRRSELHPTGILLAVGSGALATGLGYVVWYWALKRMDASRAAWLQLLVPLLSAIGGIGVLGESLSPRLACSATLILGGLGMALYADAAPRKAGGRRLRMMRRSSGVRSQVQQSAVKAARARARVPILSPR